MAFSVSYIYTIVDRYSSALDRIRRATKAFVQQAERARLATGRMGGALKRFGESASSMQSALGATGLTFALRGVMATTVGFQQSMNRVSAITNASTKQLRRMSAQAKDLGATTQFTASQSADAMGFLAMAGLDVKEILAAMPGTLSLAAAGGIELAEAADIATNVLSGFRLQVDQLGRVNDVLATTAASANTNISELAQAMKFAAPIAAVTNNSVEGIAAVLGKMADSGIKATMAGRAVNMALVRMAKPTRETMQALASMGLSFRDLHGADGQLLPLVEILTVLESRGLDARRAAAIFGTEAGPKLLASLGQGSEALKALESRFKGAEGAAAEMQKRMMAGAPGAVKELESAAEALAIALGESVTPIFIDLARWLTGVTRGFAALSPGVRRFIMVAGAVVAALTSVVVIGGILAAMLGALMTGIAAITLPIWGVIAAVVAVAGVFGFWIAKANPVIKVIGGILGIVGELIGDFLSLFGITAEGAGIMEGLAGVFTFIGKAVALVLTPVKILFRLLRALLGAAISVVKLDFSEAIDKLKAGVEGIKADVGDAARIVTGETAVEARISRQADVRVSGEIGVRADPGTAVTRRTVRVNNGQNLVLAGTE